MRSYQEHISTDSFCIWIATVVKGKYEGLWFNLSNFNILTADKMYYLSKVSEFNLVCFLEMAIHVGFVQAMDRRGGG